MNYFKTFTSALKTANPFLKFMTGATIANSVFMLSNDIVNIVAAFEKNDGLLTSNNLYDDELLITKSNIYRTNI